MSKTTCLKSRRRLFITKHNKERIRLASEDRKAKLEIRALRRLDVIAKTYFYKGLKKAKSEFKLKELLLTKLA
jgi:hypothetical protein